jgi:type 1 glutamine amidotransferase
MIRALASFAIAAAALSVMLAPRRAPSAQPEEATAAPWRILIFSRTAGFRHESIGAGIKAIQGAGERSGFAVDATEDPARFDDASLARYRAVVFLNTTGDVLDAAQEEAFQRFIRAGGGYVGIHSAADTEYDWPWYGALVGAWFRGHPPVQEATITVEDRTHPATRRLPQRWIRTDEWYDYRAVPGPEVTVLARLDETSYQGGAMGADHPIAWFHEFDGGRAFYTGGGHTEEAFAEPAFIRHLTGAILWAAGKAEVEPAAPAP